MRSRKVIYPLSDELTVKGNSLSKTVFKEAIGKTLIDMDGIPRYVTSLVGSLKYPWRCIINQEDPASQMGYWISNLSLMAQMLKKPLPSKEAERAFETMARIRFGYPSSDVN